jgi:hypothetical protein
MIKGIAAALTLLTLLAGCGLLGTGGGRTPEENVHVGVKGLVMTLEPVQTKIFPNDPFTIIGTIANAGATDVDNGILTIGLEDDFVTMEGPRTQPLRLVGRSALQPEGETGTLHLNLQARQLPSVTETVTSTVLLTMCYPYKTVGSATVCLDTDIEKRIKNKPCTMGKVSLGNGQGAPVSISSIDVSMTSHTDRNKLIPTFTLTFDNPGGGQIVAPDKVSEACSGRAVENINHGEVKAYLVDKELSCAKEGKAQVSFEKGRNVVRCTLPEGIDKTLAPFNSVLRVEVDYGYSSTISRSVQIARLT